MDKDKNIKKDNLEDFPKDEIAKEKNPKAQ